MDKSSLLLILIWTRLSLSANRPTIMKTSHSTLNIDINVVDDNDFDANPKDMDAIDVYQTSKNNGDELSNVESVSCIQSPNCDLQHILRGSDMDNKEISYYEHTSITPPLIQNTFVEIEQSEIESDETFINKVSSLTLSRTEAANSNEINQTPINPSDPINMDSCKIDGSSQFWLFAVNCTNTLRRYTFYIAIMVIIFCLSIKNRKINLIMNPNFKTLVINMWLLCSLDCVLVRAIGMFGVQSASPTSDPTNDPRKYLKGPDRVDSWADAESYCESINRTLASIPTQDDWIEATAACGNDRCWIGLKDDVCEGEWYWIDGTDITTSYGFNANGTATTGQEPWGESEPNNVGNNEDCGQLHARGLYNDNRCTLSGIYPLCGYPSYPTQTPIFSCQTSAPTTDPTKDPTLDPTVDPTVDPTIDPTSDPTSDPTADPTSDPTTDPTKDPTTDPTDIPTYHPTNDPTSDPTGQPTTDPTDIPSFHPTADPTMDPTIDPTSDPSTNPTLDGCDFDIDTYLDQCYCQSSSSSDNFYSAKIVEEAQIVDELMVFENDFDQFKNEITTITQNNNDMLNDLKTNQTIIFVLFGLFMFLVICINICFWYLWIRKQQSGKALNYKLSSQISSNKNGLKRVSCVDDDDDIEQSDLEMIETCTTA